MNAKLIRYTLYMTLLPISGVLWAIALRDDSTSAMLMLALFAALQLSVLLLCKRSLMPFIHPDTAVLNKMGVQYVPIVYQPGRFKADTQVCAVLTHLSLLPPVLVWLACRSPEAVHVAGVDALTYTAPNMNLMLAALFALLFGVLTFPIWFHAARAAAIYNTGSEKKRYLMRGFADTLEVRGGVAAYQQACKGIFPAPGTDQGDAYYWAIH